MRVLFVTPECAPHTKTGGLGDVSAALPAALHGTRTDVRVLLPGYPAVLAACRGAREAGVVEALGKRCVLREARLESGVPLYIVDCPELFVREGGPFQRLDGADWADNAIRFGVLSKVAARLASSASPLPWRPDILHCNDWPTALAPAYLLGEQERAASIVTIHNLAFQGNFPAETLDALELPGALYTPEGIEFYGRVSFLKAGLVYADAITTVSPGYAAEIRTEEFGCGMQGLLERRSADLHGVLNGIDTAEWDPASDPRIAQPYDRDRLYLKAANKRALQRRLGLEENASVPLAGMVSRLTHQKGVDLVASIADEIAAMPAQLAILGKGEREHEIALVAAAARHPGRIAVAVGFNEDLAHAIEAGSDVFLMPSRFEPCGLNQMYSQRYGTLPVACATGGLADTILDGETGFLFARPESGALATALRRALRAYADPARWRELQRAAMARDFRWERAARQYVDLYSRLTSLAPA